MQYQPGVCNIGKDEIMRRYRIGWIWLLVSIALICVIEWLQWPRISRLLLAIPLPVALSGFVQAVKRFCFAYGLRGISGIKGRKYLYKVESAEALRLDHRAARRLIVLVAGGTILFTAIYYFFP